jgi:hypothetical protein
MQTIVSITRVSEWLLCNANLAIFQLYRVGIYAVVHGDDKNELKLTAYTLFILFYHSLTHK